VEKQLATEKSSKVEMEKELLDLRKKVTLLEYDLHEAKNSQKQLQSQKEKLEGEVK